jgi:syntaxin 18
MAACLPACLLQEELTCTSQGVHQAEKAVREVATLNDMLSTAVMHQAEQIEQLYTDSLNATFLVRRGNESLRKTVAVNRSSRRYMVVLLLVATLSLLFYDWFNS